MDRKKKKEEEKIIAQIRAGIKNGLESDVLQPNRAYRVKELVVWIPGISKIKIGRVLSQLSNFYNYYGKDNWTMRMGLSSFHDKLGYKIVKCWYGSFSGYAFVSKKRRKIDSDDIDYCQLSRASKASNSRFREKKHRTKVMEKKNELYKKQAQRNKREAKKTKTKTAKEKPLTRPERLVADRIKKLLGRKSTNKANWPYLDINIAYKPYDIAHLIVDVDDEETVKILGDKVNLDLHLFSGDVSLKSPETKFDERLGYRIVECSYNKKKAYAFVEHKRVIHKETIDCTSLKPEPIRASYLTKNEKKVAKAIKKFLAVTPPKEGDIYHPHFKLDTIYQPHNVAALVNNTSVQIVDDILIKYANFTWDAKINDFRQKDRTITEFHKLLGCSIIECNYEEVTGFAFIKEATVKASCDLDGSELKVAKEYMDAEQKEMDKQQKKRDEMHAKEMPGSPQMNLPGTLASISTSDDMVLRIHGKQITLKPSGEVEMIANKDCELNLEKDSYMTRIVIK